MKAQIVAESLKPDVTVNAVAARYGLRASPLSEWRGRARDGKLVLPAMVDDGFCFAPIVLSRADRAVVDPAGSSAIVASPSAGCIEIAVGTLTIRLDGTTAATRIAEIVRAIGPSS